MPEAVFGNGMSVTPNADGSIYKLIRYPDKGYWVSYSKTAGKQPLTTVMLQKIDR